VRLAGPAGATNEVVGKVLFGTWGGKPGPGAQEEKPAVRAGEISREALVRMSLLDGGGRGGFALEPYSRGKGGWRVSKRVQGNQLAREYSGSEQIGRRFGGRAGEVRIKLITGTIATLLLWSCGAPLGDEFEAASEGMKGFGEAAL
jgi:hypothetical protein